MIARFFFLSILLAYCTSAPAGNPCVDGTGGISADPNDNSKFLKCHLDVAFSQNCPPGLVFNAASNICDWPSTSASKTAPDISNSHSEFSNLNFESQNFPTTTLQPITTSTQSIFTPSNQLSEFSNLNFGGETFQTTLSPVFTTFSSLDPVTFASATESSAVETNFFNVPTTTQSSEFSNFNFGSQEFQTTSVQTQFATVSPFEAVTETNSQFFQQASSTTKKSGEKVFMSFRPTMQANLAQQETTTPFSQFNEISATTIVSNVVEQEKRPKQTVVNNFIFEEVGKNNKIDRNHDNSFVEATRISNIALVPTVDLPTRTKDDKKVKISVSDLNSLFQNQVKSSTLVNTQQQVRPEQKVPTTTTTTSTHSSDYDYDYEEQIMTTIKSRIRPQHLHIKTTTQTVSTIPTTTTLSATTIVDHLIFENILRNQDNENEQSLTTTSFILHDQSFDSNNEKIARNGISRKHQEIVAQTTTLSHEDYYDYEEETTTPFSTTTRRSKHLRKRPHKTTLTTSTTTTTTTTRTTSTTTTTVATTPSVKIFDDDFGDFEISSSTSPSFDFINDELDATTRMPLREKIRIKATTVTSTLSHSEKNMFSLEFDEPEQNANRFNEKASTINQISNSNLPNIDFTVNTDRLETSTNFPLFDISEPRDEIDFSKNTLSRNKFKKKLMEKMTTAETPITTTRIIATQTRLDGFDLPSSNIHPPSTQEKLRPSKNKQNRLLIQGSNKNTNENLAFFDDFEDDSIDEMRNSEKSTTVSPSAESISFNFSDEKERVNIPTESKTNAFPNFEVVEIKTTTRFSQFNQFPTQAPKIEKFGSFNFEPIPRHN